MFLVTDPERSACVFLFPDPRDDGYRGLVEEGVSFEDCDPIWPDGAPCPEQLLGVSPNDPKVFRVFRYEHERRNAGFTPVHFQAVAVFSSWADYVMAGMRNRIRDLGRFSSMLRAFWRRQGMELAKESGIAEITPSIQRRLTRKQLDRYRLSEDEKTCHLFEAFPDDAGGGFMEVN